MAIHQGMELVSLNVGQPQHVVINGREFTTATIKSPVAGRVAVRGVNVAGDDQADRTVHGGASKSLYAYASEDYAWWTNELGVPLEPGHFGNNLTTQGLDVSGALVGERWRIGSVLFAVTEPRIPCFKLGWRMNDMLFLKRFAKALRPGSYLTIIEPGEIGAGDAIEIESRHMDHDITIREFARIFLFAPHERSRLLNIPSLDDGWRAWAAARDEETG